MVQVRRRVHRETAIMQLMTLEKLHGPVLKLDPLHQIPLEQAEPPSGKVPEDVLISGQRPIEMTGAIVPAVKMKGRAEPEPPLMPIRFALSYFERVTNEVNQAQIRKNVQGGQVCRL